MWESNVSQPETNRDTLMCHPPIYYIIYIDSISSIIHLRPSLHDYLPWWGRSMERSMARSLWVDGLWSGRSMKWTVHDMNGPSSRRTYVWVQGCFCRSALSQSLWPLKSVWLFYFWKSDHEQMNYSPDIYNSGSEWTNFLRQWKICDNFLSKFYHEL